MDYSNLAATTLAQIADKGRTVTVRSPGVTQAYNPANDTYTAGTDVDVTAKALFTKFSSKDIAGDVIRATDSRVLIAASALSAAPDTDDKIIDNSTHYNVINVETVKPGDTAILYILQVRK